VTYFTQQAFHFVRSIFSTWQLAAMFFAAAFESCRVGLGQPERLQHPARLDSPAGQQRFHAAIVNGFTF
jgi:hypothetical protein